ncbi:hypothetical protein MJT46_011951 [Ovis ammon polii x Ovis aries]|nr:hypothetical protein MJT46_011951 [Ovis ammon polii x Ovis aries]
MLPKPYLRLKQEFGKHKKSGSCLAVVDSNRECDAITSVFSVIREECPSGNTLADLMEKNPDTNEEPILCLQTCLNQRSLAIQGPVFLIYFKIKVNVEMRQVFREEELTLNLEDVEPQKRYDKDLGDHIHTDSFKCPLLVNDPHVMFLAPQTTLDISTSH